jgi:hypothetical protein
LAKIILEVHLSKIKCGGVYEIKLLNKYYVYVCEIMEYAFGIFDLVSETPIDIKMMGKIKFKDCKRTGITKKEWKKIGTLDLVENSIKIPDRAVYYEWNIELSYKNCLIVRDGLHVGVTLEEYKKTLETGFSFGVYDNYKNFEEWIYLNLENIKNKTPIKSISRIYEEYKLKNKQNNLTVLSYPEWCKTVKYNTE